MVGRIDAIVGGVVVALALGWLLEAPVLAAAVTGTLVGRGWPLCFAYRVQRFRRAAAVVRHLYESQSPDMPGWTQRAEGRGA